MGCNASKSTAVEGDQQAQPTTAGEEQDVTDAGDMGENGAAANDLSDPPASWRITIIWMSVQPLNLLIYLERVKYRYNVQV